MCVVWLVLPAQIVSVAVLLSVAPDALDPTAQEAITPGEETRFFVAQGVSALIQGLVYLVSTAACFKAIADAYLGAGPTAKRSLSFGLRRVPRLLALSIVSAFAFALAFGALAGLVLLTTEAVLALLLLMIPAAIYVGVSWSLSTCALLFEDVGPIAALRRSWALVHGSWWRVFGVLAVGVLLVSALRWPLRAIAWRRAAFGAGAAALAAACVLVPQLFAGPAPEVFTAAGARRFPEFGPNGTLHFFADSTLAYLRQNRSGFDLRYSGSLVLLAAVALLVARPANLRLLRAEVLAMPAVALTAWAAAQAVLFRLYLPHRYTYPLVAFAVIVIGTTLRPTFADASRRRAVAIAAGLVAAAAFAVWVFPLAPVEAPDRFGVLLLAAGAALLLAVAVRPAAGAVVAGALVLVLVLGAQGSLSRGNACPAPPVTRHLAALPKDAIVAGDPEDLKCLPLTARRAVVISGQLAPAYEIDYFLSGRNRMFADLAAVYGPSPRAIAALRTRYGATHLWIRRRDVEAGGPRWRPRKLPYGRYVQRLRRAGPPASLRLPAACRTFARGQDEVYDLACLAGS
jgi:hypothetical protein